MQINYQEYHGSWFMYYMGLIYVLFQPISELSGYEIKTDHHGCQENTQRVSDRNWHPSSWRWVQSYPDKLLVYSPGCITTPKVDHSRWSDLFYWWIGICSDYVNYTLLPYLIISYLGRPPWGKPCPSLVSMASD